MKGKRIILSYLIFLDCLVFELDIELRSNGGTDVADDKTTRNDHDRIVRLEEQLFALREVVSGISPADHDRIISLEGHLEASNVIAQQRSDLLVARIDQTTDNLGKQLDNLRTTYERAHDELVNRVTGLGSVQSAITGTTSGTMRVFLVAAVMISLAGVLFTVVHLITG